MKWLQKQKGIVSLSALADTNMPKGSGKKPNTHRKASLKSSTKRIKSLLAEADSEELTPRIKISNKTSPEKRKHAHTPKVPGDHHTPMLLRLTVILLHCVPRSKQAKNVFLLLITPKSVHTLQSCRYQLMMILNCHSLPFTVTLILLHWILGSKLHSKVLILLTSVNMYTLQSSPMTFLDLLDYHTVLVLIHILLHCTLLLLHLVLCHPLATVRPIIWTTPTFSIY